MRSDALVQDIRYAVRILRRAPLFVVTVVATIGLGLGLAGSAFTILNAYLLRPIDLPDPHALHALSWDTATTERHRFGLADYEALQREATNLSQLAAAQDVSVMQDSRAASGLLVTGNYFQLLGAAPALGRLLRPDDAAAPGASAVVVLSYNEWRSNYGSNPGIIGQRISLGRQRFEVVGVTQPHSNLPGQELARFWVPLTMASAFPGSNPWSDPEAASLTVISRLRPDASPESMRAWLDVWLRQRFPATSDAAPVAVRVESLATPIRLNGAMLATVTLIMVAVGLVLLVACANVTNLMLARAVTRQQEITVRVALGASRWRVARQLIVESLVLAVPAAGIGLALSLATARLFPAAVLATFPADMLPVENVLIPLDPDLRVMAFLSVAAVFSAVLVTLAPIVRFARLRLTLSSRSDVTSDVRGSRLRSGLVAMQIGACVLFLVGAVSLLDESSRLANPHPNLEYERVSLVRVDPTVRAAVAARLSNDAAVEEVAVTSKPPLMGRLPTAVVTASASRIAQKAGYTVISPEYFQLFDIRIVRGRAFTSAEAAAGAPVALVSKSTAAALWAGLDPLGQTLDVASVQEGRFDRHLPRGRVRVIGVAEDVANGSLGEGVDVSCLYFPTHPQAAGEISLLVRTRTDNVDALRAAVESALKEVAPEQAFQVIAMRTLVGGAVWIFRALSVAVSLLGIVGLLFAYSGTHAVVSFMVVQRTREFGVRMALGAGASRIIRSMMVRTSRTAAIGLVLGLAAAAGLGRLFSASVALLPHFSVRPFVLAATIVSVAACVAALLPLSSITRIDPAQALRTE